MKQHFIRHVPAPAARGRKPHYAFLLLLAWLTVSQFVVRAQVVTTQPAFPTADGEVTLIFDVKQAKDSRAKGLLGKTDDVYLWSGAGSTATGDAFQFQPAGQTNFSAPFGPGKMTPLGNDRWQIKLVPRTYFNVPAGTPIRRLGLLLKSGNGQAQTEDLFVTIYDDRLNVSRLEPTAREFYVDAGASLLVRYKTSKGATLTLKLDGQTVATVADGDSLGTTLNTGATPGARRTVIFQASTTATPTGETAADTFFFTVRPQPNVAPLPTGAQDGINYVGNNRAILVLYAPKKSFVYVLGEFNNFATNPAYLMNRTPDGNRYWIDLPNLTPGAEVAFQYLIDGTIPVGDPYADKILDRNNDSGIAATTYPSLKAFPANAQGNIVSVMQPGQTPYAFQTTNFQRPDAKNLVVYELLVRDFSASRTYKAVQDSLPYLKRLGINTIELMPIGEFSGNNSWGYNPIYYFAPDKAYGAKDDLKRLIDAAHQQGIAVVLDMVLNQADYEFPYVKMYWAGDRPSADNPYFNQQATHPFSVFFDFNHESADTKAFVDRVCRYWLTEYRFDGYRFDLSKGFTQKNTGGDVAAWGAYDPSRIAIWKRIYDQIRSYDPSAYVILEHFADNTEEKELAAYGMMLWGNHNGDYRSAARIGQGNFSGVSYQQRGFAQPNLVGYFESHDEERLAYDLQQNGAVEGTYNVKSLPTTLNRAKLAAAFLLTVPGPKMLWQFGELGYDVSINACANGTISDGCRTDPKPVRPEYYQDAERRKLYRVYSELIKLKTTVPAFTTTDFTTDFGAVVKRLTLRSASGTVYLIGNFDLRPQTVLAGFPAAGTYYHYFTGQEIKITDPNQPITLEPGAFHLYTTQKLPTPEAGLVPFAPVPSPVTAINEPGESLTVSPNPADGPILVELTSTYRGLVQLELVNPTGRTVRKLEIRKTTERLRQPLNGQTLPTGQYILRVQQGNRRSAVTVLKR